MIIKFLFSLFFVLTMSTACSVVETEVTTISEIDAEEVLTLDSEADIFQYNGIIYKTNIDWVDELTLSPQEELFEISHQTSNPEEFSDHTANTLPVGTSIYSSSQSDVLIADVEGERLYYLAIVEG